LILNNSNFQREGRRKERDKGNLKYWGRAERGISSIILKINQKELRNCWNLSRKKRERTVYLV